MVLLENDSFLTELTKLFQKGKASGSVQITMKRYDGRTKPKPRRGSVTEPSEYKCLIRATLGNKKISTVIIHMSSLTAEPVIFYKLEAKFEPHGKQHVSQKDVNRFQMAYANLLKGNMDGLKKKDKKTAKKTKSKATQ